MANLPYIGHASGGDHGAKHNQAGDQSKKEVTVRDWYVHKKGWGWVFRAKSTHDAEKIAKCMEDICENDLIGYDQADRLTLYNAVKNNGFRCSKAYLKKKVECDCSAAVRVCLAYAGIHVENFRTATQVAVLSKHKKLKKIKYKGPESLKRGDILVTQIVPGHTAVILSNGSPKTYNVTKYVGKGKWKATAKANMNVRVGASTGYKVIGSVKKGTSVEVLEQWKGGDWLKIVWPGRSKGYAFVCNADNQYFNIKKK
jgi:hypothetical protein